MKPKKDNKEIFATCDKCGHYKKIKLFDFFEYICHECVEKYYTKIPKTSIFHPNNRKKA